MGSGTLPNLGGTSQRSHPVCYHVFLSQVICTYMAKKTLFQVELNHLKAFSVWDIIFPYWETLSENRSHKLTGAHNNSTLEAMNWRLYCLPIVGVHCLESPLCPSGPDWQSAVQRALLLPRTAPRPPGGEVRSTLCRKTPPHLVSPGLVCPPK